MDNQGKFNKFSILLVAIVGLFFFKDQAAIVKKEPAKTAAVSDEKSVIVADGVQKEFANIQSKEDKLLIHKLFSGSAEYIKNAKILGSTSQFDPVLGKVQSSYGWNREKYPKFTDAVSEYLVSVGYDEPKELATPEARLDFSKIFEALAEATKYE